MFAAEKAEEVHVSASARRRWKRAPRGVWQLKLMDLTVVMLSEAKHLSSPYG
jgi:hypothetical protein